MTMKWWGGVMVGLAVSLSACGDRSAGVVGPPAGSGGSPVAVGPVAGGQTGGAGPTADEQQILSEVNAVRAQARDCGSVHFAAAGPLTWNAQLATAARLHSQDMADRSYFAHDTPDGVTPQTRMERAGYTGWTATGENIAAGYTVSKVMAGWLASPGHCENIMRPQFRELGVGIYSKPGSAYGSYFTQDFGAR